MFFEEVTPIEKLHEILTVANPELAQRSIERALIKLAACELALEENGIDDARLDLCDEKALKLAYSIAIDMMATIVSHNE